MELSAITGLFVGYELNLGCPWRGIYMVWSLDDFVDIDLSSKSSALSRRMRRPHKTKVVELPDVGMSFPLKSEYDRANHTFGRR